MITRTFIVATVVTAGLGSPSRNHTPHSASTSRVR